MKARHILCVIVGFVGLGVATAANQDPVRVGSFVVTKRLDLMTDQDRSFIAVVTAKGALSFRCEADGFNVQYMWGKYLIGMDREKIPVGYRFAPNPAAPEWLWTLGPSNSSAYAPPRDARQFTADALNAKSVVLRVTSRDGDSVTEEFSLEGLQAALQHVPCYNQ